MCNFVISPCRALCDDQQIMIRTYLAAVGMLISFSVVCSADTIQLSSGQEISGVVTKYRNNAFEVRGGDGKATILPVNKVKRIQFEAKGAAAKILNRTRGPQQAIVTAYDKGMFTVE